MEIVMALTVGGLYACGIYLMLRRTIVKLLLGLALISHAANLLIFTSGGLSRDGAPIIPDNAAGLTAQYADPLPQALILTAIVIGFGVIAFAMVLLYSIYKTTGSDDVDALRSTDT